MSGRFVKFTLLYGGDPLWVRPEAVVAVHPYTKDAGRIVGAEIVLSGNPEGFAVTDEADLAVQRIQIAEDAP